MWEKAGVVVTWRTLRYPQEWPDAKPEEKGIDVALAIDLVRLAIDGEYDVGIDVSSMPIERWGDYLRSLSFEERRPCLARARTAYDIRRRVPMLIEFYDRIRRSREAHHAPSRPIAFGVHS